MLCTTKSPVTLQKKRDHLPVNVYNTKANSAVKRRILPFFKITRLTEIILLPCYRLTANELLTSSGISLINKYTEQPWLKPVYGLQCSLSSTPLQNTGVPSTSKIEIAFKTNSSEGSFSLHPHMMLFSIAVQYEIKRCQRIRLNCATIYVLVAVLVSHIWLRPLMLKEVVFHMLWMDLCPLMYPLVSLDLRMALNRWNEEHHAMSWHAMTWRDMNWHVRSYQAMSRPVMSYPAMPCHIILYRTSLSLAVKGNAIHSV